ncbi:lyase family protein [Piscinibacter sakaiensis]|uniref:3-carboxy-cis,cis-muconate cycloisomerase n=1 Tax=Piscinibacter sakaiensis TaxID=1547922 RepID=A0A0K8NV03_PISS1|nr:lyase family protein [Piscinibacter sakaiensis]GAP33780.1 3-carboxy-cis,cis-muconate cycloisomerase [Piscinibacter sakaiensis]
MSAPFEAFLSTPQALAAFDAPAVVQAMLDVEAALVRAQAAVGLVPLPAAQAIAGVCKAELFDVPALVAASGRAGSLAIPLVRRLTETVALFDAEAAGYVHWGSTSQDVIDTALALLQRRALAVLDADLARLAAALLAVAHTHEEAPLLARTLLQPAQVISWGHKAVGWIAPLLRTRSALRVAAEAALQLQLGGAVGTRAMLGPEADAIARHMAEALGLRLPPDAWHTQRDEAARLYAELGVLCGVLGKLARDLSLLAQAEVGEAAEPSGSGRGGSSAMPHKRNPVASMVALAAALRAPQRVAALLAAMVQEHERGLGNWQSELAEAAGLFQSAMGAAAALAEAVEGLQVDPARMRRNIDALHGLVYAEGASMALAAAGLGKSGAHALLERLSRHTAATGEPLAEGLRAALQADAVLRERLGPAFAAERLDATLEALFDARRAAEPAIARARPRLAALQREARALEESPPPWPAPAGAG